MGKGVVEKKRKKKGRPSLLDLQKRSLKEQQQQQLQQHHQQQLQKSKSQSQLSAKTSSFQNPNPNPTTTTLRRSTRRNPNPNPTSTCSAEDGDEEDEQERAQEEEEDEEDGQLSGKPKEKKLNLVLKSSGSVNSSNAEDRHSGGPNHRKRKADAIGNGSGQAKDESNDPAANAHQGVEFDNGPSTPLPDKKLLLFILDRLQKKDTYGVFAEPVDPEELPDYHEVIEHPMDFSTIKKKLDGGSYANLEQFEKDVLLICLNAMQYNAPDTIYFRQARSMQELAKKNFENLRQDSDDNEPEPKIVKRGRPPTKNLNKPVGRPSLEGATSEPSGAALATGGDNSNRLNYDVRKQSPLEKFASADSYTCSSSGFRQPNSSYINRSAERYERNEEVTGTPLKGILQKHGKKLIVPEDSKRNTYTEPCAPTIWQESSVLTMFNGERRFLFPVPVGFQAEYGYARSLARFAAKLGPVAWKVASKKILRCLPNGVKFGPGWIGENEAALQRTMLPPPSTGASRPLPLEPLSVPGISSSAPTQARTESCGEMSPKRRADIGSSEKHLASNQPVSDSNDSEPPLSVAAPTTSVSPSPVAPNASSGPSLGGAAAVGDPSPGTNLLNSNASAVRLVPPLQIHHNPLLRPHMNGVNGTFEFNIPSQMGKLVGLNRPTGLRIQAQTMSGSTYKTNHIGALATAAENDKGLQHNKPSSDLNSDSGRLLSCSQPLVNAGSEPADGNPGFQSSGSSSSGGVHAMQPPDLALQL